MSSSLFFDISAGAYLAAMVLYVIYLVTGKRKIGVAATVVTVSGFVCQSTALLIRWVNSYYYWISDHPTSAFIESILRAAPLRNLYESLIFFVWLP